MTMLEQQVLRLVRLLEVMALLLLVPAALLVDLWVLFLEHVGWRRPNSVGIACVMSAACSYMCVRSIDWAFSYSLLNFEHIHPPTDVFEVMIRIHPNKLSSLLYHVAVCFANSMSALLQQQHMFFQCLLGHAYQSLLEPSVLQCSYSFLS